MLIKTVKKNEKKNILSTFVKKKKTMKLFATKAGTQSRSKKRKWGVWIEDKPLVINFID